MLTREEPGYPQNLLQINAPPPFFIPEESFFLGIGWLWGWLGLVKMTSYGRDVVEALVPELSLAGLT